MDKAPRPASRARKCHRRVDCLNSLPTGRPSTRLISVKNTGLEPDSPEGLRIPDARASQHRGLLKEDRGGCDIPAFESVRGRQDQISLTSCRILEDVQADEHALGGGAGVESGLPGIEVSEGIASYDV